MKNSNKGFWAILLSLGVLVIPTVTLTLTDSATIKGSGEPDDKKEDPTKDKKKTIDAICDINPDKLNMKSKGKFITVYIEIVNGYDVYDIILGSILLNDFFNFQMKPISIGDRDNNNIPDLMIKYDRSSVISFLQESLEPLQFWEVTITGKLIDGVIFKATSVVELIHF
ncbi:MAG: hypothetical protein ACFFE5_06965 [Candidatus Thorarchaeota archaeon]